MAVLYRKYRSKSLDELIGQDHITTALKRSINTGNISHAYLFTGPKGTGKTSVARILAYELNNLPYDESATHLDIIEIDAASNRRIDEIRDLRDKVHIAPTSTKYKVYIIDEVHMLTKEAFNALLKTLEEPPAHVIFILATTELHKIPETIISRTQRFSFKPIEKSKIVEHLAFIAKKEGIHVDAEALSLIAEHAGGGFRDAISLLDQVRNTAADITASSVLDSIGSPSSEKLHTLWDSITQGSADAQTHLFDLYDQGYHAPLIAKSLLREAIAQRNTSVAKRLLEVTASHDPRTDLLLLTMEIATPVLPTARKIEAKIVSSNEDKASTPVSKQLITGVVEESNKLPNTKSSQDTAPVHTNSEVITAASKDLAFELWNDVLEKIKEAKHAVYGPLRLAQASLDGSVVRLGLSFPFHIKRVSETKNIDVVISTIKEVTHKDYSVEVYRIEQGEQAQATRPVKSTAHNNEEISTDDDSSLMSDPLSIVKNVFGGAQVL